MSDYEMRRAYSDIQSKLHIIDYQLTRLRQQSPDVAPGRKLVANVCAQILRGAFGEDRRAEAFERAAANPAYSTVAGWAAELCQSTTGSFILSIVRRSAWAGILARSPQVSVLGIGTEKVPITAAVTPATIVTEGSPIPVRAGAFSAGSIVPFKLAAIMSFTSELARSTNIEGAIRSLLQQSISAGFDSTAFAASGTGSILAGVTPTTASTATPLETAMRKDLEVLLGALSNPTPDTTFVMSPPRVAFATSVLPASFAYPIAASSALAAASIVAVDPNGVAAAIAGEPRIVVSETAALHMDDAPAALGIAGAPNSISAPTQSLFQADILGLRVIAHAGWVARAGAVAQMASVSW